MALLEFKEQGIDYAVLECGLGGRLDSTNVVKEVACAAITSIGLDHQKILGHSLNYIAAEKAGIIKPGVRGCIIGPTARQYEVFREKYIQSGCPNDSYKEITNNSPVYNEINTEIAKEVVKITLGPDANKIPEQIFS